MSTTLINRPRLTVNPSRIARRLAENTRLWDGVVEFDPAERWYTRIAREHDWEAWLLSWLPGQGTDWHDHGGSAGALLVLRGRLVERTAEVSDHDAPRIDAWSRELATDELRAFGGRHLHQVDNESDEPAVSLHVYSPGLHEMNDYVVDPSRADRLLLSASRTAGVSW